MLKMLKGLINRVVKLKLVYLGNLIFRLSCQSLNLVSYVEDALQKGWEVDCYLFGLHELIPGRLLALVTLEKETQDSDLTKRNKNT